MNFSSTLAPSTSPYGGGGGEEEAEFIPPPQKMFEFALMLWLSALMFLMSAIFFALSALPCRFSKKFSKQLDIAGWSVLYFAFSISLVVYNKWLISVWGFNFPITITLIHMMLKLVIARVIVRGCRNTEEIPTISNRAYLLFAIPVGATTALDVAASNASFYYVTVTVYTIVKSTALLFVLLYSILYKLQHCDWRLFACTGVILAGVLMSSVKETSFEWIGFTLVLMSAALGGYRWVLTEMLMHNKGDGSGGPGKMNALMTIYVISPASVLVLIPFFFWFEFDAFVSSTFYSDPGLFTLVVINVIGSGVFAFAMIYVELAVLKRTSSLSLVVIGYVKQMLQIIFSAILFHDVLLPVNIAGVVVTFLGMGTYSAVKHHHKKHSVVVSPDDRSPLRTGEDGGGIGQDEEAGGEHQRLEMQQTDYGLNTSFEDIILHKEDEDEDDVTQAPPPMPPPRKKGPYEMVRV